MCYEKVIGIDPNHVKAWNSKGLALMALDRIAEAEIAFANAGKP
jgi:cytochrome c-type biogenesis protein CcmH/NrfG